MPESGASLALTLLHLIFVSVWVGGLTLLLAAAIRGARDDLVTLAGRVSLAALLLAGLTGLLIAATKYGDPASWFKFGTTIGRIGEKIVGFIVAAALAGYGFHALTKKSKIGPAKAALAASLLASIGIMLLGLMLARGF